MTGPAATMCRFLHRAVVVETRGASGPKVLIVPAGAAGAPDAADAGAWALPAWRVEEARQNDTDVGRIASQARELLGFDVGVLRYVDPAEDEAGRSLAGTWIIEPRGGDARHATTLAGGRWAAADEIRSLAVGGGEEWGPALRALTELESGVLSSGPCPWYAPGWLSGAERWVIDALERLGRPATGPVVQLKNNSISSVLRAPTASGEVYFKAASRHFGREARITRALAERFPERLPTVLAADEERSWLLLEDFGPLLRHAGVEVWEAVLGVMGELQRRCAGESDWLFSIGAADRRLAMLREQIPALLDAPETRREVDPECLARLVVRVPELQGACDELAACGVPETLVHGDLHGGNVAYTNGRLTLFDWTDAAVGHPFLDLVTFLPTERRTPVAVRDFREAAQRMLDVYLEGWTEYAPVAQLRRAVELVQTVQQLHHAQTYLEIQRSLQDGDYWQWEGELAQWLTPLDPAGEVSRAYTAG